LAELVQGGDQVLGVPSEPAERGHGDNAKQAAAASSMRRVNSGRASLRPLARSQ
jgi:hypothetical protein